MSLHVGLPNKGIGRSDENPQAAVSSRCPAVADADRLASHWNLRCEPMTPEPASRHVDATDRLSDPQRMPRRVYVLRVLGMGLGVVPMAVVLRELDAGWASWAYLVFAGLLWPHLAYLVAMRSADPYRSERRNLVVDAALAGFCVPLMQFNLLPSVMLMTVVTADRINTGIRGLWLRSLPGLALGIVGGGFATGFAFAPHTSMAVMLACLPMLVGYTLSVSLNAYRLVRKVQAQNRRLAELSSIDPLTGLNNRGHWQVLAERLLREAGDGDALSLVLIDVDRFKAINDGHGHAAGDDVLVAVAGEIKACLREGDCAGRLGGDEFALILRGGRVAAEATAERLRAAIDRLSFPGRPGLQCSVSLGLADLAQAGGSLRVWMEAADRALYRAKSGGRNQVGGDIAGSRALH
jgi:diguanylate cyclase